jgi:hypothetical protein
MVAKLCPGPADEGSGCAATAPGLRSIARSENQSEPVPGVPYLLATGEPRHGEGDRARPQGGDPRTDSAWHGSSPPKVNMTISLAFLAPDLVKARGCYDLARIVLRREELETLLAGTN